MVSAGVHRRERAAGRIPGEKIRPGEDRRFFKDRPGIRAGCPLAGEKRINHYSGHRRSAILHSRLKFQVTLDKNLIFNIV